MDELLKNEKLGDLYAYYGKLLTKGQQAYFEDYYYNDYSLGEIAANHQVSRQAVYDNLRRSSKALNNYEENLHMKRDYDHFETAVANSLLALENDDSKVAEKELVELLKIMRGE